MRALLAFCCQGLTCVAVFLLRFNLTLESLISFCNLFIVLFESFMALLTWSNSFCFSPTISPLLDALIRRSISVLPCMLLNSMSAFAFNSSTSSTSLGFLFSASSNIFLASSTSLFLLSLSDSLLITYVLSFPFDSGLARLIYPSRTIWSAILFAVVFVTVPPSSVCLPETSIFLILSTMFSLVSSFASTLFFLK